MKNLRTFENMENYIPVKAVKDDDGHWYVIPVDESEDFFNIMEKLINCDYDDMELLDEFESKFGNYKTGGDLNLKQLYIKN